MMLRPIKKEEVTCAIDDEELDDLFKDVMSKIN